MLTYLFSFFVESAKLEKRLDTARTEIVSRQLLQTRLQTLFSNLKKGAFQPTFYTKQFPDEKNQSLLALFDNGIDPDPAFSGAVLARIFLDENKNLSLALWPAEKGKNHPLRKEILLSNVSSYSFEFLKKERQSPLEWAAKWKPASDLPSIVRLSVVQSEKQPLRFAFFLPSSEPIPTYYEGGKKG